MADKLIVIAAITDEANAEAFMKPENGMDWADRFDLLMVNRTLDAQELERLSVGDLADLFQMLKRNYVGRIRHRREMSGG